MSIDKNKKQIIILLMITLVICIIRISFYYSEEIVMHIEQIVYDCTTSKFDNISIVELQSKAESDGEAIIYIGSRNCGDCRYAIKKIQDDKDICQKNNVPFFYNSLDNSSSNSQIEYLKETLKIKTIPTIIIVKDRQIRN